MLSRQAREEQNRMEEEEKWIKTKVHGIDGKKSKDSVQETCFFIIHINKHVVVSHYSSTYYFIYAREPFLQLHPLKNIFNTCYYRQY